MDVFLMVRRQKTSIFIDAEEKTDISEVKKMIHGITKVKPENQKLFYGEIELENHKKLKDYHLTVTTASAQSPATIGLVYDDDDDGLQITPFSKAPDLSDLMSLPVNMGNTKIPPDEED